MRSHFIISFMNYLHKGIPGAPGEVGREGPKGKPGQIITIGERVEPEPGDIGDAGYPGMFQNTIYDETVIYLFEIISGIGLQGPEGDVGPIGDFGYPGEDGEIGETGADGMPVRFMFFSPSY